MRKIITLSLSTFLSICCLQAEAVETSEHESRINEIMNTNNLYEHSDEVWNTWNYVDRYQGVLDNIINGLTDLTCNEFINLWPSARDRQMGKDLNRRMDLLVGANIEYYVDLSGDERHVLFKSLRGEPSRLIETFSDNSRDLSRLVVYINESPASNTGSFLNPNFRVDRTNMKAAIVCE